MSFFPCAKTTSLWNCLYFILFIALVVTVGCHPRYKPVVHDDLLSDYIRPEEMSNLAVKILTISPIYPIVGEQTDIDISLENQADFPVQEVELVFYVANRELGRKHIDMQANEIRNCTFSWTPSKPGTYTLAVIANSQKCCMERNLNDNEVFSNVVVTTTLPKATDLAITKMKLVDEDEQSRKLHVTILNNTRLTVKAPLSIVAGEQVVSLELIGPVQPEDSVRVAIPWPQELAGERILAEINPRFRQDEPNPDDNSMELDTRPELDILINKLSVSAAKFDSTNSKQITISFRIVNSGRQTIKTPFRTNLFIGKKKSDREIHSQKTYDIETKSLETGQTVYVSRTITLPAHFNEFDVRVYADIDQHISESIEYNNIVISHYKNPVPDVDRWASIGPTHINLKLGAVGRITTVAIDPVSPSTIYVGARGSGVWKTTNGGATWYPITDAFPTLRIAAVTIDPSNSSRIYVATENMGVFRSNNAGISWIQLTSSNLRAIGHDGGCLLVHPTNPNIMYLTSRNGIYRSNNGGVGWNPVLTGGGSAGLVMDPANPNHLYASIGHKTNFAIVGIYETTNGGATQTDWVKLSGSGLPVITEKTSIRLALTGDRVYTSFRNSTTWTLYRKIGAGAWEQGWQTFGDNRAKLWSWLHADPSNPQYVYAGGTHMRLSTDGGMTFPTEPTEPHVDHHGFTVHPSDPKIIFTGSDGGLYKSTDRGKPGTWSFVSEGVANVEFYDIADAPTQPELVIGGTQDNGASLYDGSNTNWKFMVGGDSEGVEYDPTDHEVLYEIGQEMHQMKKTTGGGVGSSWPTIGGALPEDCSGSAEFGPFDNHLLVHPKTPSILLATCGSVWRGMPWTPIFTRPPGNSAIRLAVDKTIDLYYVGTRRGDLYAGPAGAGWQRVFYDPISVRRITDIEINLDDPRVVYLSFGGTKPKRIYRLRRLSSTPAAMVATNITSNFPTWLEVRALAVDRMAFHTIYAATANGGVYRGRSLDDGATWSWSPYNNGLPSAVTVTDLEVHPTTGAMRAGTFGRSAYEVNTDFPIGSIIAVEGKVTLLRVHDVGTGYGPSTDFIDVEVVIQLDSQSGKAFGFQLRRDANESARCRMLDVLRDAFNQGHRIRIDYERTGLRNGIIKRVMEIH